MTIGPPAFRGRAMRIELIDGYVVASVRPYSKTDPARAFTAVWEYGTRPMDRLFLGYGPTPADAERQAREWCGRQTAKTLAEMASSIVGIGA
jgi:hypothetical protein